MPSPSPSAFRTPVLTPPPVRGNVCVLCPVVNSIHSIDIESQLCKARWEELREKRENQTLISP